MSVSLLFPVNHVRGSDLIVSMTIMIILGMETQEYAEKMESLLFDAHCCSTCVEMNEGDMLQVTNKILVDVGMCDN